MWSRRRPIGMRMLQRWYYRRTNRSRYGRPFGLVILLVILALYILTHIWLWIVIGLLGLAVLAVVLRAAGTTMPGSNQQQQAPPVYQPYQEEYQGYEQGLRPRAPEQEVYQEGGQQWQSPPQPKEVPYPEYEYPQAQYPDQEMPPSRR